MTRPLYPPLLADVLQAVDAGIVVLDGEGVVAHVNGRLRELLGLHGPVDRAVLESVGNDEWRAFLKMPVEEMPLRWAEFELSGRRMQASCRLITGHAAAVVTLVPAAEGVSQPATSTYASLAAISDTAIQRAIELKHEAEMLEHRVVRRTAQLHQANMDAVWMLAVASEAKDHDTGDHVRRVQGYAYALAKAVGIEEEEAQTIGISSILHDVGKIHVPDSILSKPGALTAAEYEAIQEHTVIGERILSRNVFFQTASKIARSHHENWDGSGYPDGLKGEAIPIEARIVHLVDVVDALGSERSYKEAWAWDKVVERITCESGRMFDPALVVAFEKLVASKQWPSPQAAG